VRSVRSRAPAISDRTREDRNANAFAFLVKSFSFLPAAKPIYSALLVPLRGYIGMVDLGFTIIRQSDDDFHARIRAEAPRNGVPDIAAADAEKIAEAYMRYSYLIGILEPCNDAGTATWMTDVLAHPDLTYSGCFV
jgi:hypothetical protein